MSDGARHPTTALAPGRVALAALVGAALLTLLFTAQDALRRGPAGGVALGASVATNALDWGTWALLVPLIATVGARIRLDEPSGRARRIAAWAALGVACHLVQAAITGTVMIETGLLRLPPALAHAPPRRALGVWLAGSAGYNLIIFAMIAAAFHAALYAADARARERREAELGERLARAELTVLRMQLQPHFFFNALHTVSSLMVTDVPTAQRVIAALGDLVRASIDHTARQEVPLREELTFVRRYVEIQTARFRKRLAVVEEVAPDALDALVPSLVLQPLVENAIRHGIEPYAAGGRIWIRATREGERVTLAVVDDASAAMAATASVAHANGNGDGARRSGIGLANLESRLAQLYGDAQRFRAGRAASGHFEVSLTIPYRPATVEATT